MGNEFGIMSSDLRGLPSHELKKLIDCKSNPDLFNQYLYGEVLRRIRKINDPHDRADLYSRLLMYPEVEKRKKKTLAILNNRANFLGKKMALEDYTTGLLNRRSIGKMLEVQSRKSKRNSDYKFSVIMADLDYFKKVNDEYGHDVGDAVLKSSARCLMKNVRGGDTAGRYGGEEFIAILPDTGIEKALKIAERVRKEISNMKIHCKNLGKETDVRVTASFGVAGGSNYENAYKLVKDADIGLYAAKRDGRNCIFSNKNGSLEKYVSE